MRNLSQKNRAPQRAPERAPDRARGAPVKSTTPLGDERFHELIRGASVFFAEAERDVVAEKAQAVQDIQRLMAEYGIKPEDLVD